MGGSWLRSGALSDEAVIATINERLVPVWIDIRHEPVPALPPDGLPPRIRLDRQGLIANPFSEGFFVRSLVLSPDGRTLLNPQPDGAEESRASLKEKGYFSYAQVKAADYLPMLRAALARVAPAPR